MSKFTRTLMIAATALSLGGTAFAEDAPQAAKRSCAFVDRIYNFKEIDDRTAIIQTSPRQSYKVTFFNSCGEMRWAFFARVEARPGICLSRGDKIIVGHSGFTERCIIDSVEALPPKVRATPASQPY